MLLVALEAELRFAAFNREHHRLSLTADCLRLHQYAERVLAGHDEPPTSASGRATTTCGC